MARRPIDVINDTLLARSIKETAEWKEKKLNLPTGFVGEVLASGGVVGLYFNMRSREMYGWTGSATGGRVIRKEAALRGLHGDSIVNSWGPNQDVLGPNNGLHTISCDFTDPAHEDPKFYARVRGDRDELAIALDGPELADDIGERIAADPRLAEAEILSSPWLTVSRLGLKTMIETVHPEGYLARLLPEVDDIVFEKVHMTKKQSEAEFAEALGSPPVVRQGGRYL